MSKKIKKIILPLLMAAGCFSAFGVVSTMRNTPSNEINDSIENSATEKIPGIDLAKVVLKSSNDVKLQAVLTLTDDILVKFTLEGSYENVKLCATLGSGSEQVLLPEVVEGVYSWVYKGITPQNLATNLALVVKADVEGQETIITSKDFTVKEYCDTLLNMEKSEGYSEEQWAKMKRAVANLLRYGGASERYLGSLENNVDSQVDENLLESADYIERNALTRIEGTVSDGLSWYSGNLWFDYKVALDVKFKALEGIEGVEVYALINGRETKLDVVESGEGTYRARLNEIGVLEYNDAINFEFRKNGVKVSQTLTYSVNSYVANMKDDDKIKELASAIYCYGKSVTIYSLSLGNEQITYEVSDGVATAKAKDYILEEVNLSEKAVTLTDVTPIASEHHLNWNSYSAGKANISYVGEYGKAVYKENVTLDDMLRFGSTTYYEIEGALYRDGEALEGVEVSLMDGRYNVTLTNATLTSGIEVWNKAVTFNLVGQNNLSGTSVTEIGTHTVGDTAGVEEKLPYALYVAESSLENEVKITGEGSLVSEGGAKIYTNATIENASLTFNVGTRTSESDGVVGDLESEGLNMRLGTLTANNATINVLGAENTDTDKSGITLNNATFTDCKVTVSNFGFGLWLNGAVKFDQSAPSISNGVTSDVKILNAKRYGFGSGGNKLYIADGDFFIDAPVATTADNVYVNGEYTKFTLSARTTTSGIVNAEYCDEYNYYGKENAEVYVAWKKDAEKSWIELYSTTGKFQMRAWGSSPETGGWWGTVNGRVDGITITENSTEKMALYIIYSEVGFSFSNGLWKGNYIHTDAEGNVSFLKYKFRQDSNHNWISSEVTRGMVDARLNDGTYNIGYNYGGGVDVTYNGTKFHMAFCWQSVMLGI